MTADGGAQAEAPAAPPYEGTFAEGMNEVVAFARDEEFERALEVADSLLAGTTIDRLRASLESKTGGWSERAFGVVDAPLRWLGFEARTSADRAEIHYAKGLLHARKSAVESSNEAFELARMLAGEGQTRLDAMYNLGNLDFGLGEFMRGQIPELNGGAPGGSTSPLTNAAGQQGSAPGSEEKPDPLALARAAYTAAKDHFVERLRADWQDADTRANLELCMRRLAELDQLEQEREEQEQQDQEQQDQEAVRLERGPGRLGIRRRARAVRRTAGRRAGRARARGLRGRRRAARGPRRARGGRVRSERGRAGRTLPDRGRDEASDGRARATRRRRREDA